VIREGGTKDALENSNSPLPPFRKTLIFYKFHEKQNKGKIMIFQAQEFAS